jgi:hypothetical protein
MPFRALPPSNQVRTLGEVWTRPDRASSPIWVMCCGVVSPKLLVDETGAMTKTVSYPLRRSRRAARLGQDGEMVIRGTFTSPPIAPMAPPRARPPRSNRPTPKAAGPDLDTPLSSPALDSRHSTHVRRNFLSLPRSRNRWKRGYLSRSVFLSISWAENRRQIRGFLRRRPRSGLMWPRGRRGNVPTLTNAFQNKEHGFS